MGEQWRLASAAGIDAFCVYHYWFDGRRDPRGAARRPARPARRAVPLLSLLGQRGLAAQLGRALRRDPARPALWRGLRGGARRQHAAAFRRPALRPPRRDAAALRDLPPDRPARPGGERRAAARRLGRGRAPGGRARRRALPRRGREPGRAASSSTSGSRCRRTAWSAPKDYLAGGPQATPPELGVAARLRRADLRLRRGDRREPRPPLRPRASRAG